MHLYYILADMHVQQDSTNNFDFQSPLPSLVNVEILRFVEPGSVILVVTYEGPNFVNLCLGFICI